jgi:hypothetical protein
MYQCNERPIYTLQTKITFKESLHQSVEIRSNDVPTFFYEVSIKPIWAWGFI